MNPAVSEKYAFVISVDTHAATHSFALVTGGTGAVLDHREFPTTATGLPRALSWVERAVDGTPLRRWWSWRARDRSARS